MAGTALVTGGTGRVGSVLVARLEDAGFRVKAAGRRDGDLARPGEARALVERTARELGALDLVVHAASAGFVARPVADVSEADWDAALGATAKGAFFVAQASAPHLARSSLGLLVLVEDVAAYQPWPLFAPHCAAKAAEAMLTRVLARALAPDVRVCGIAPGTVTIDGDEGRRAAETLLGRVGTPDDVADALLYLVDAGFVTGTTLVVDGGRLIARRSE
ncbi:MAG: SDR family oxidoreductase [Thermoleophilia bacterium]|nr:SDR family oxidoreductase [Thermoleophilia bacterium]